jgi:hypothetical protein
VRMHPTNQFAALHRICTSPEQRWPVSASLWKNLLRYRPPVSPAYLKVSHVSARMPLSSSISLGESVIQCCPLQKDCHMLSSGTTIIILETFTSLVPWGMCYIRRHCLGFPLGSPDNEPGLVKDRTGNGISEHDGTFWKSVIKNDALSDSSV